MQNLSLEATALDIRNFFYGLNIPNGGVHIVGGDMGDVFIAFLSDEDARKAMMYDHDIIRGQPIRLFLSSRQEMEDNISAMRKFTTPAPNTVSVESFSGSYSRNQSLSNERGYSKKRKMFEDDDYSMNTSRDIAMNNRISQDSYVARKSAPRDENCYDNRQSYESETHTRRPNFENERTSDYHYGNHKRSPEHQYQPADRYTDSYKRCKQDYRELSTEYNRSSRDTYDRYDNRNKMNNYGEKTNYQKYEEESQSLRKLKHNIEVRITNEGRKSYERKQIYDKGRTSEYDAESHKSYDTNDDRHGHYNAGRYKNQDTNRYRSLGKRESFHSSDGEDNHPPSTRRYIDDDVDKATVFIGNLSRGVTFRTLRHHFVNIIIPQVGIKLINDLDGERIGCGFIQFHSEKDCDRALKMNGSLCLGHKIKVLPCLARHFNEALDSYKVKLNSEKLAKETLLLVKNFQDDNQQDLRKTLTDRRTENLRQTNTSNINTDKDYKSELAISIDNIPPNVKKTDLVQFLGDLKYEELFIEYHDESQDCRQAFIVFENSNELERALLLDKQPFQGNTLTITKLTKCQVEFTVKRFPTMINRIKHRMRKLPDERERSNDEQV